MSDDQTAAAPPPPPEKPAPRAWPRVVFGSGLSCAVLILIGFIGFGYCSSRLVPAVFRKNETRITNDVVIEQMRAVAKLVSSEATVRDVVVYENTWYGSTKRSLVVITGKLLAGIDLANNPDVNIDDRAKKITIRIPSAQLIAVEVVDMHTYDERGGLWNPFKPEDRDAIQRQAKAQLVSAGNTLAVLRHANESAVALLKTLLAKDGYTVDVTIRGAPPAAPPG